MKLVTGDTQTTRIVVDGIDFVILSVSVIQFNCSRIYLSGFLLGFCVT